VRKKTRKRRRGRQNCGKLLKITQNRRKKKIEEKTRWTVKPPQ
jgi:hypothetical protein